MIYKLNRKEKVKIKSDSSDGKFKKKDNEYKLQLGDEVKIFLTDEDFLKLTAGLVNTKKVEAKKGLQKEDIVFEDGDLLVINKNPGINVHPGDHKSSEVSVIEQVQDYLGEKFNSLTFKPSLIHRIDRDTSGLLLIAKKKDILVKLADDFKSHKKIRKFYYTIVIGKLSRKEGVITKKLKRIENAKNENKIQISDDGQTAISKYKLIKEHKINTREGELIISEVEVEIETGRMHQVRVHMFSIGNPIIGDKTYGDAKLNSFFTNNYGLKRQALHASKIEFFHYGKNKEIVLEAKQKEDMKNFIKLIDKKD